ncbi:ABC transporter ATP-binding protein [Polynucleobacter paneuropaeus]|nr:ABC transporter ATP-binding protein [Polynucleobacter paneuropaeus]
MKEYLSEIFFLLGKERKKLPLLAILFIAISILDLLGIGLIGPYIALIINPDTFTLQIKDYISPKYFDGNEKKLIAYAGMILVLIFVSKSVASIYINKINITFSQNQQARLQLILMSSYQKFPYEIYMGKNSASYLYNIQTLTNQFSGVIQMLLKIVGDGIVAFFIIIFLFLKSPLALITFLAILTVSVYIYDKIFKKNMKIFGLKANMGATLVIQGVKEGLAGFKEIRVLGIEKYFYNQVADGASMYAENYTRTVVISSSPRLLLELFLVIFIVSLVLLALLLGESLELLIPTLGIFGVAALRILPAANSFASNLIQLRYNRDAVSRLYGDIYEVTKIESSTVEGNLENHNKYTQSALPFVAEEFQSLFLDNVSYRYPGSYVDALRGVSLTINCGELIGVIGESGAGKTTLVDLFLGLLKPSSGGASLNGRNLYDVLPQWYRQAAYLPQQPFIIDAPLRNNIALGVEEKNIDEIKVQRAVELAQIDSLVSQLPQGLGTLMGDGGISLSGGQRQRVALARAFYHDRQFLILDESTSALDSDTEAVIVEEIHNLKRSKTIIVIAHRLSTLKYCDRIYRIGGGKVLEELVPHQILE